MRAGSQPNAPSSQCSPTLRLSTQRCPHLHTGRTSLSPRVSHGSPPCALPVPTGLPPAQLVTERIAADLMAKSHHNLTTTILLLFYVTSVRLDCYYTTTLLYHYPIAPQVVTERIAADLMAKCHRVGVGLDHVSELHGDFVIVVRGRDYSPTSRLLH